MLTYYSLLEPSGYGNAALEYIRGLNRAGLDLKWQPLTTIAGRGYRLENEKVSRRIARLVMQAEPELIELVQTPSTAQVEIFNTIPELWDDLRSSGNRSLGMLAWETTRIPRHWIDLLNRYDELIVPSGFCHEVMGQEVKRPVHVVPHMYRHYELENNDNSKLSGKYSIPDEVYMFYTINTWTVRKAVFETLKIYLKAFTKDDPVTLFIKTSPTGVRGDQDQRLVDVTKLVAEQLARYRNPARVIVETGMLSNADIDWIHRRGNCYVSLARGEGFGLGALDATAFGNPVIMIGWGGQLEFLDAKGATLLHYQLEPVVDHNGTRSYSPDQQWAVAVEDSAATAMRRHLDNPARFRQRAGQLLKRNRSRFSQPTITRQLLNIINDSTASPSK